MEVKLVVLEGKQKDRQIPLPETIFLIGRDRQCHLRPHCQGVSSLHCAIAAWAGKVRVRDLRSRNGTFLNGRPIHGEVAVEDGDRLQVGTIVFAIRIANPEGAPTPAPIRDERELGWLLHSPADSDVLGAHTCVVESPTNPPEVVPAPASIPGSKAVSAGQHLHAYFQQRTRRPRPAAGPELPDQPS